MEFLSFPSVLPSVPSSICYCPRVVWEEQYCRSEDKENLSVWFHLSQGCTLFFLPRLIFKNTALIMISRLGSWIFSVWLPFLMRKQVLRSYIQFSNSNSVSDSYDLIPFHSGNSFPLPFIHFCLKTSQKDPNCSHCWHSTVKIWFCFLRLKMEVGRLKRMIPGIIRLSNM